MRRSRAQVEPPVVLSIAGSDSGGGAGIQADLKTIEAGGAFGTSAVTSVTAQNTQGVESTHVLPTEEIRAQCSAVFDDFEVAAIKTGMLATEAVVDLVTDQIRGRDVPAVVDPVMVAASGDRLLDEGATTAYEPLIASSRLVTPNADEAEILTGVSVSDTGAAETAGEHLVEMGADAALVKGGHIPGDDVVDVLVTSEGVEKISHPRVETDATHGSGCTLSSAIATRLAYSDDLVTAVRTGTDLLGRAVRYGLDVGDGPGAVHHVVAVRDRAERQPTAEAVETVVERFVDADISPLVPEVGMNVVGATPYAETPSECAAVEGRIARTMSGVNPNRGVRYGASGHVARLLIAAREGDPDVRFAANCRFDEDVEFVLDGLGWRVVADDGADASRSMAETTTEAEIQEAFRAADERPVAAVGAGPGGAEPVVTILAPSAERLTTRVLSLLEGLEGQT